MYKPFIQHQNQQMYPGALQPHGQPRVSWPQTASATDITITQKTARIYPMASKMAQVKINAEN